MTDHEPSEVLFRASKRRKVFRRPTHADPDEVDGAAFSNTAENLISEPRSDENGSSGSTGIVPARRRGGAARTGISFSSAAARRGEERELDANGGALVAVEDNDLAQIPGSDRFVKPMGRVELKEDKHMMAYVDSKLAETRPGGGAQTPTLIDGNGEVSQAPDASNSEPTQNGEKKEEAPPATQQRPSSLSAPAYQQAQQRSARTYQKPSKRRHVPSRKETDLARDSMIEQIMGQNDVPHYQHAVSTPLVGEDAGDVDHDAAAADAFKAQLLADFERNRRRPPMSKNTATTSSGPKLGGSRSQREKMKALEEAKGSAGRK